MTHNLPIGTVVFDGVSKRYRLGGLGTLRSTVSTLLSRRRESDGRSDFWALKDVGFRVDAGDTLALIGPNGAGKTTTFKLLANVTQPSTGRIAVSGRVSSLIELGAGFHPELSGRENVFMNGAILGLRRREIQRKLDAIIAFSELERFIDTPVKRYSSGMYVRLGFAVAAHVEPDIMLVDEVLAVGDASFRQKCMERMHALRRNGTTILFVSHNMAQVEQLCKQAMVLVSGRQAFLGDVKEALQAYQRHLTTQHDTESRIHSDVATDALTIRAIEIRDESGQPLTEVTYRQQITVSIHYCAAAPVIAPLIRIWLLRSDGTVCAMGASNESHREPWQLRGNGTIAIQIAPLQLVSGQYKVEAMIVDREDTVALAGGQSTGFYVQGPWPVHDMDAGVFVPLTTWHLDSGKGNGVEKA